MNEALRTNFLAAWTTLKQNLLQTIQVLKANHKDNWAVVKVKSTPHQLRLPTATELTKLQQKISLLNQQIQELDRRASKELLSLTDQTRYQQLAAEVNALERELKQKQELANFATQSELTCTDPANLDDYLQQLRMKAEYDNLKDKLKQVRILVNDNQLEKLKGLVQQGEI